MPAILTVDLHNSDDPKDIYRCGEYLLKHNIPVLFFIPTELCLIEKFKQPLEFLKYSNFDLGTHAHKHNREEMNIISNPLENPKTLLTNSKKVFEDFFNSQPLYFRSPAWCKISNKTIESLDVLGYKVDCSYTPQRIGLFSSSPFKSPYLFSKRKPFYLTKNLLEIPTSCLIVPLAEPTYRSLNGWIASILLLALKMEGAVINIQTHPADFSKMSKHRGHFSFNLKSFFPYKDSGVMFRHFLKTNNSEKIFSILEKITKELSFTRVSHFLSIYKNN